MPARNEADRYLESCLTWAAQFADAIHVYDDNSTDETANIALDAGAYVSNNTTGASFVDHEGEFRQAAWHAFEAAVSPTNDDWVLCLDADEFLVAKGDLRQAVEREIVTALALRAPAITFLIPELFAIDPERIRIDGFWPTISGLRLFPYRPYGRFNTRTLGCGSAPVYATVGRQHRSDMLWLLHYGYVDPDDRLEKYERYNATSHGHADRHIASIPARPVLQNWDGPTPVVWRGQRVDR